MLSSRRGRQRASCQRACPRPGADRTAERGWPDAWLSTLVRSPGRASRTGREHDGPRSSRSCLRRRRRRPFWRPNVAWTPCGRWLGSLGARVQEH
eukprot:10555098-Alexandrium_andersonii.AAC.1